MKPVHDIIRAADMTPFVSTWCADPNDTAGEMMRGRSHFYDAGTLRYFQCRVNSVRPILDGVAMTGIMSQAGDMHNAGPRVWRFAVHDFTGYCLSSDNDYTKREHAEKACAEYVATLETRTVLRDALERVKRSREREMRAIRTAIAMMPRRRKVSP